MIWKKAVIYLLSVFMLLAVVGCSSRHPDAYYKGIQIQWLDEAYEVDTIEFDNEWLQKRCLAAAEGQDLTTIEGLTAYLDNILPTIERYFARDHELSSISHYDNGIWAICYVLSDEFVPIHGGVEIYYISENSGTVYNREIYQKSSWGKE